MPKPTPRPVYSRLILELFSDKWAILVLSELCHDAARFNEIKRRIEGVSQRSLTQCRRRLERNGLVGRTVKVASPVSVEYSVTKLGRTLVEPFEVLQIWTTKYETAVLSAQFEFDKKLRKE